MAKAMKEQKDQLPANIDFEGDSGSGFESADIDSFAVPFLVVLQKNSPQCDDDSSKRIEEARPGMLFNTVTEKLYPARNEDGEGVLIVPVAYKRQFLEWTPRNTGGGLAAIYSVDEGLKLLETCNKDENGRPITEDGNIIADSRMHFVMANLDGEWTHVIIAMSSTQIKHSRKWMSIMDNLKMTRSDGTKYTPAMFSHIYKVSTQAEENSKGTWRGWKVELKELISDAKLYSDAKDFRDKVVANEVTVSQPTEQEEESTEI